MTERVDTALMFTPFATMAAISLIWWRPGFIAIDETKRWASRPPSQA